MEKTTFYIWQISDDICRIESSSCLQVLRDTASGGCITNLEVMLAEMRHIEKEAEKIGYTVSFEFAN